ncbi:MAG: enoyl-CoA hydratase-related protein [Deltaproteobacteria bacterium]
MEETGQQSPGAGNVDARRKGRVLYLTMTRPEVMNAMNGPLMEELEAALAKAGADRDVGVVVLDGAGGNFCSGADMRLLGEGLSAPDWVPVMQILGRVIRTIREIPQPVVSKVRGAAVGGGANLALAADFVVAGHDARFCQVFINLGVGLDAGGTYFLPRLVGLAKARELALLGETISGEEAASIGLIYKSVPDDRLDREVDTLASKLAAKSLQASALIKSTLERSLSMSLAEVLDMETVHQAIMFQTTEHKEAVRSFFESRGKPKGSH